MLSKTLQGLERDGFVICQILSQYPPVVYYSLSNLGHSLHEHVNLLTKWASENMDQIDEHRLMYDAQLEKENRAPWQKEKTI